MGILVSFFNFVVGFFKERKKYEFQEKYDHKKFQHPFLNSLFNEITSQTCAFPISADNVEFIETPKDFYQNLKDGILNAKERIVISSLYLGTGDLEKVLIESLDKSLEKKDLKVTILLDYLRGTRGNPNSSKMFEKLVEKYPKNINVYFYQTPNYTWFKKMVLPERANEIIGLQHIKTYIFDDNVIMSGANLSDWYFVDRQDRYILFKNEKEVTDYYNNVIEAISTFSFHQKKDGLFPPKFEGDFETFANETLKKLIYPLKENNKKSDTWIVPSLQMGQLGIRHDEDVTEHLLKTSETKIEMCSAYFNFPKKYQDLVLNRNNTDIITASPHANGFFGSKGFSGYIPLIYSIIEERFYNKIKNENVKLYEYNRDKWTFHGKGLWLSYKDEDLPIISMIGSPNFGNRSVNLDTEAQMIIFTENKSLRKKLKDEYQNIFKDTYLVNSSHFEKSHRVPTTMVKVFSKFVEKYM